MYYALLLVFPTVKWCVCQHSVKALGLLTYLLTHFLLVRNCNYSSIMLYHFELFDVESLKVIQTCTIRKLGCGFLFAFRSNYGRISLIVYEILSVEE